jgi:hypothetical protein
MKFSFCTGILLFASNIFGMDPAQGARFLDSQHIIEGLIISKNNKRFSSSQWHG